MEVDENDEQLEDRESVGLALLLMSERAGDAVMDCDGDGDRAGDVGMLMSIRTTMSVRCSFLRARR